MPGNMRCNTQYRKDHHNYIHHTQVLRKDMPGEEVEDRMDTTTGSGTRGRKEPSPYSGVLAYEDETVLHVIEGSHHDLRGDKFSWEDAKELKIPKGWGLIFSSCLVHAGGSYESVNGRLHLYLKAKGGLTSFDRKFNKVQNLGEAPSSKLARRTSMAE